MTDREKLCELVCETTNHDCGKRCNLSSASKCYSCTHVADHLLANGVTFATDTNVGSTWISVEDRLPTLHDRILVWCESKTIEKHITACTYMGDGKFSRHVRCVTHWMPLPEAPKGE